MDFEEGGRRYVILIGSDIHRDGMYAELQDDTGREIAEVFFQDPEGPFSITLYAEDLHLTVVERLIAEAKRRLPQSGG